MTPTWRLSHRADPVARALADRHYNRQTIGAKHFVPPGRCCVFYAESETGKAFWVTSWPFSQYVLHRWGGYWVCSAFRNENCGVASDLILDALAHTRWVFGDACPGMITFVDRNKVKGTKVRGQLVYGWTFLQAGFKIVGETQSGLLALIKYKTDMPLPKRPITEIEYKVNNMTDEYL